MSKEKRKYPLGKRVVSCKPLGGLEYMIEVRCSRCESRWRYVSINIATRMRGTGPKFHARKLCPDCKKADERQKSFKLMSDAQVEYIKYRDTGFGLTICQPIYGQKGFLDLGDEHIGIRDAAYECTHGRLPGDRTHSCGCWSPRGGGG